MMISEEKNTSYTQEAYTNVLLFCQVMQNCCETEQ